MECNMYIRNNTKNWAHIFKRGVRPGAAIPLSEVLREHPLDYIKEVVEGNTSFILEGEI